MFYSRVKKNYEIIAVKREFILQKAQKIPIVMRRKNHKIYIRRTETLRSRNARQNGLFSIVWRMPIVITGRRS